MTRTRKTVIVLLLAAALLLLWSHHRASHHAPVQPAPAAATAPASTAGQPASAATSSTGESSSATGSPSPAAPTSTPAVVTSSPAITSGPTGHGVAPQGVDLAHDWLTGYLTRPHGPSDTSWTKAIAPYSDPALVETLKTSATPVGITWSPWKVASIKADNLPDQPVNTPTRQVSSWLVTITGPGKSSAERLYTLTAYQGDNGVWTVSQAEQGYYSHG